MARIRTIKPEFFRHHDLYLAELESKLPLRVAFAGLWTAADREGRFKWSADALKLDCLPYDKIDFGRVLEELRTRGFITKYSTEIGEYGFIPSWKNHQVINPHEAQSKIPDPDECDKEPSSVVVVRGSQGLFSQHITDSTRETVYAKDGHKCIRCFSTKDLTVDHIFPRSMGGSNAITNLRTLCRSCNSARPVVGDEFIKDLIRDGLTLNDMERMCMQVQRTEMNVHARGEGKGKEGNKEGKGREQGVVDAWNLSPGIKQIRKLDISRTKHLKARLSEPDWDFEAALKKFPLQCTVSGTWVPDFDWFLRPGTVNAILEGKYDFTPGANNGTKPKRQSYSYEDYEREHPEIAAKGDT